MAKQFEAEQHKIEKFQTGNEDFKSHTYTSTDPDGTMSGVLRLTQEGDEVRVGNSMVEPKYQGKGIGKRLYEQAIKDVGSIKEWDKNSNIEVARRVEEVLQKYRPKKEEVKSPK